MVKADIVKEVAEKLRMKEKDALVIVDMTVECVKDLIVDHERLEIRDFGVFQVKLRKPRIGRNPRNKKSYPIPPHRVVTFKPGKQLKDLPLETPDHGSSDGEDD